MPLGERHKKLIEDGTKLFSDRRSVDDFWQTCAENFYPEVASFTLSTATGRNFADNMTTSYPFIARRTLGDSLSALLRPVTLDTSAPGVWFAMRASRNVTKDVGAQKWLEYATKVMRMAMYDREAMFVRATKEGDHFFATFGQCVLSLELNRRRDTLLYRNWHLKDVVWCEDAEQKIDHVQRRWQPTASQLASVFRDKVHAKVQERLKNAPYDTIECRHIVIATENYEQRDANGQKYKTPWVSIWIDVANDHVMEEIGIHNRVYIIPRWVTIPGSQYANSPCVTAGLSDARLLQAMTLTMLEAGEKYANPPMIGVQQAMRSDVNLLAGGMTWIDAEYDERTGEAMRPAWAPTAGQGLNAAFEQSSRIEGALAKAFFLDSLSLPPATVAKEMTAFEVGQRISEWIRRAMPIFEPMEFEYNAAICEETFGLLMANGAFGPRDAIPQRLRGDEIQFKFESPLHEGADRRKGQKFLEAQAVLAQTAQTIDPSAIHMLDAREALRDVLSATVPAAWQRSDEDVDAIMAAQAKDAAMSKMLGGAGMAADVADKLGSATKNFAAATQQPAPAA